MTAGAIGFRSQLTRRDLFRVATVLALRNPLSLTAFAAPAVLWIAGTLAGGHVVADFAVSIALLMPAVPLAAVAAASYAAYRPTAAELFVPVDWEFSDEGVILAQEGEEPREAEWSDFSGWRRVSGCYLLHTAARKYLVLPVASVPDERREDFEALLSEHLRRVS